jgi:hypothetical protein
VLQLQVGLGLFADRALAEQVGDFSDRTHHRFRQA